MDIMCQLVATSICMALPLCLLVISPILFIPQRLL